MQTSSSLNNQQSLKCESTGKQSYLHLLSPLAQLATSLQTAMFRVLPDLQHGRVALNEAIQNKRLITGLSLGMVGVGAIFSHHFFKESVRGQITYYQNYFYLFFTLRLWVAICFFATASFLCVPTKYKLIWVVYALVFTVGLCGVVHYSFFVRSNIEYHQVPAWYIIITCLSVSVGFIKSVDYLCYRKYHLKDGNIARIIGIIKTPNINADQKMKILEQLVNESENFNARI